MRIGVLALQGAFIEHEKALQECNCEAIQIRKRDQLDKIDGLIIPGGESTTIGKLLVDFGLQEPLIKLANEGLPIFGTCAGLIVLAKDIVGSSQPKLGLMDISAKRNAFGRQVDSFEADLEIKELGQEPFKAVFIRAPYIERVGSDVQIMATFREKIVLAKEKNYLAAAFHPELTNDLRIHQFFIDIVRNNK